MHQKRTTKLFLLTTWRMALTTKRTIFLFFSERHLSRKERNLYFLPLTTLFPLTTWLQKNCSFWLHVEWLSPQKERFFCSFLNVVFLEKVICTFCLAKCIRKGQKNCSFWLHEAWLSPQKEQIFCSFLNVFLERTAFVLFALPNASEKDKQIVPFEYMKNGSLHKKSKFVVPFLTSF